jgi:hypothetical protein
MKRFALALAICGLLALTANAAPFYSEDFEAYTLGSLVPQDGWITHSGTTPGQVLVVSDNGPTFPGVQAAYLQQTTNSEDVSAPVGAEIGAGETWYCGADVKISNNNNSDYFMHFIDMGTSFYGPRLDIQTDGAGFDFGFSGVSSYPAVYDTTPRSLDTWYRVVFAYSYDTGITKLWVDPSAGDAGSPLITGTFFTAEAFDGIAFREASTGSAKQTIDNILVGRAFSDVIPEPATLLLLSVGGLALLRRRR